MTLGASENVMEEVVVVGYGTTKKINLTGSVATVDSKTIETAAPVASTTSLLAGRLPGLISRQNSGSPGRDGANLSIRGFGDALIIVDGVEAPINNLDPNEIESVSILKDASAAVYGSRAGNGVILVTTKRGRAGKPTITLNSTYTQQRITNFSRLLNGGEFAEWDRENKTNRGLAEAQQTFTQEQVDKYYAGTDPNFPSTNWYDVVIRPSAPQQQHNVSIRGGSEKVKYYGLIGYLDQNTFWRSNGGNFKRFNIRSNIDANITDNLVMKIGFSNINEDRKFPAREDGGNDAALWQDLQFSLPTVAAFFPDRTLLPDAGQPVGGSIRASSDYEQVGYRLQENQLTQINAALEYNFPFLEGLSARVMSNYAQANNFDKTFNRPASFYNYNPTNESYVLKGTWNPQASVFERRGRDRMITNNLSLNYSRTFAQNHQFSALLLHESITYGSDFSTASRKNFLSPTIEYLFGGTQQDQSANGSASEMGRKGYVGRINYIFKNKYLFEATLRADASAKFPPGSRWGYFPSVSVGWVLSEENFMEGNRWLQTLKIRASYSQLGDDGSRINGNGIGLNSGSIPNFAYLAGYKLNSGYIFDKNPYPGLETRGLANSKLTWETLTIYNGGLDFTLNNSKLYGDLDVFYRQREGIPGTRVLSLPSTFGAVLPLENLNSITDRGFELRLGTRGRANKLTYDVSGNISWARSKWNRFDEPVYTDPDIARTSIRSGQWTDRVFGFQTDGLYTSQGQIDALAFVQDRLKNATLRPGDVRYIDNNGDGVIDFKDIVEIGNGQTPHWIFGLNSYVTYKNFDVAIFFQGGAGHYVNLRQRVNKNIFDNSFDVDNPRADALFGRNGSIAQGGGFNDFLLKNADYVRLKSLNIGYSLPSEWMSKIGVQRLRVFLAGFNLLTLSELNKYDVDPEAPTATSGAEFTNSYYPQQKTYTIGLTLTF